MATRPAVIIDTGSGYFLLFYYILRYSKFGYSTNIHPDYIIPTTVAVLPDSSKTSSKNKLNDLDFYIGDEALSHNQTYSLNYPIAGGIVEDWNSMEFFLQKAIYKYLNCDPEEHQFLITESTMNTPENREYLEEIMFETFNVPSICIQNQALLSLQALYTLGKSGEEVRTGCVIDSGEGGTQIIPIAEGMVLKTCIKTLPIGGRHISEFMLKTLRERGEQIPPQDSLEISRMVKEKYCYVCKDLVQEYNKYDENQNLPVGNNNNTFEQYSGYSSYTNRQWNIDIGYERFIGPESYFSPDILNPNLGKGLPNMIDDVILSCPIDCRRGLYSNIVLSGGSTNFKNFGKRIEKDLQNRVDKRIQSNLSTLNQHGSKQNKPALQVHVNSHKAQGYAAYLGGSILVTAFRDHFNKISVTKEEYEEHGASIIHRKV